jgi:GNAT superfamily N-acetyltransferase
MNAAGAWLHSIGIAEQWPSSFSADAEMLWTSRRLVDEGKMFVAVHDGQVVESMMLKQYPHSESHDLVWPDQGKHALNLYMLAVRRTVAGRGVASRMLSWAAEYAGSLGLRELRLDFYAGNDRLRRYYSGAGFNLARGYRVHGSCRRENQDLLCRQVLQEYPAGLTMRSFDPNAPLPPDLLRPGCLCVNSPYPKDPVLHTQWITSRLFLRQREPALTERCIYGGWRAPSRAVEGSTRDTSHRSISGPVLSIERRSFMMIRGRNMLSRLPRFDLNTSQHLRLALVATALTLVASLSIVLARDAAKTGSVQEAASVNAAPEGLQVVLQSVETAPPEHGQVSISISPSFDPNEFDDLVPLVKLHATLLPTGAAQSRARVDLIRNGDGAKVAQVEVPGTQLIVLKRPSLKHVLVSQRMWDADAGRPSSSLLILDAARGLDLIATVVLPERYASTVPLFSGAALSSDERHLFYAVYSRSDSDDCSAGRGRPEICDLWSIGILDLDSAIASNAAALRTVALPLACGAPVITPTRQGTTVVTCRMLPNVYHIDASGSVLASAALGIPERANQFASLEPSNGFGFLRSDNSLAVMSWRGTVSYRDGSSLSSVRVLPPGMALDPGGAAYILEDGQVLVTITTSPSESVTGYVVFDPERLVITDQVSTGAADTLSLLSAEDRIVAVIRSDGMLATMSPTTPVLPLSLTERGQWLTR